MDVQVQSTSDLSWVLEKLSAAKRPKQTPAPVAKPQKDFTAIRQKDLDLWRTWHKGGQKKHHLAPLLKSFEPLIQKKGMEFKNRVEIPTAAIDAQLKKHAVEAFKTFDESKGKLHTWVNQHLQQVSRYVNNNKNAARITENIYKNIGRYNSVKADLTERYGHEPDTVSLQEEINKLLPSNRSVSMRDVIRMGKEQRKGLISTGFEDESMGSPGTDVHAREKEVRQLIYYQLNKEEKIVHEYVTGSFGRPKIEDSGKIAKKLGWHVSKVSKIKTRIADKMRPYLS